MKRSRPRLALLAVVPASLIALTGFASAAHAYPVGGATISSSTGSAPICTSVSFSLAGWMPGSSVRVYYSDVAPGALNSDGVPSNAQLAGTEITDASGAATDTFDFTSIGGYTVYAAGNVPTGQHDVEATHVNATANSACDPAVTPTASGSPTPSTSPTAGGGLGSGSTGASGGAAGGSGQTTQARATSDSLLGLLPFTGTSSLIALLLWGLGALLVGLGLVTLARKQRRSPAAHRS